MIASIHLLEEQFAARPAAKAWFDTATADTGLASSSTFDDERFLLVFSSATRRLGKAAFAPSEAERERLRAQGIHWQVETWGLDELGRAVLLAHAFERLPPARAAQLLENCYARADNRERQAVLRALPFLPDRSRFVPLTVEACRTSVQSIFEAIACENPFPADEFSELAFNQLVLKAFFTGVAMSRIVGLERRLNPELARMAQDYAAERRAAGRSVPADIDAVTRPQRNGK
ncbi:MAG TPA: EboA domain-containing protein [Thermoanaerobaculia bacterium]